jgi:hypothetical protein
MARALGLAGRGPGRAPGGGPLVQPRVGIAVGDAGRRGQHLAGVGGAAVRRAERELEAPLEVEVCEHGTEPAARAADRHQ